MVELDNHEVRICRELIKNPRISDNKLAKNTGIPVMTVNRKRKSLEKKGIINYYTSIHHGERGTAEHNAKQLYILKFKLGLTKNEFLKKLIHDPSLKRFYPEYVTLSYIGEQDGHFAIMMVVNAATEAEMIESFNGHIVPNLKKLFGEDAIIKIYTFRISESLRIHHNYLPSINMESGVIRKDWPDDYIFVTKESFTSQKKLL